MVIGNIGFVWFASAVECVVGGATQPAYVLGPMIQTEAFATHDLKACNDLRMCDHFSKRIAVWGFEPKQKWNVVSGSHKLSVHPAWLGTFTEKVSFFTDSIFALIGQVIKARICCIDFIY